MRLAIPLTIVAVAAALLSGCGGSDDGDSAASTQAAPKAKGSTAPVGASAHECKGEGELRATGLPCKKARSLMTAWGRTEGCAPIDGASRSACGLSGAYRCLSVVTEKGISVSCAKPGRSLAFTKPG
ncbi:MAG TPA: hypothetical protein VFB52_10480 [Solirubrobacterales bacterium]|nr:hypothetical protein [Solirubrobacterales bacterium]